MKGKVIQRVLATIGRMDQLQEKHRIDTLIRSLSRYFERKFEFDVERAIFLTALHRLFASGSDRWCDKWRRDYVVEGEENFLCITSIVL
jgi:hypothetical protein